MEFNLFYQKIGIIKHNKCIPHGLGNSKSNYVIVAKEII